MEVFEETSKILSKLKSRDCKEALDWCNTHKTKLQKSNVCYLIDNNFTIEPTWIPFASLGVRGVDKEKLITSSDRILKEVAFQVWPRTWATDGD